MRDGQGDVMDFSLAIHLSRSTPDRGVDRLSIVKAQLGPCDTILVILSTALPFAVGERVAVTISGSGLSTRIDAVVLATAASRCLCSSHDKAALTSLSLTVFTIGTDNAWTVLRSAIGPNIIMFGRDMPSFERSGEAGPLRISCVTSIDSLHEAFCASAQAICVVSVDTEYASEIASALGELASQKASCCSSFVVLCEYKDQIHFQQLVDNDRLFYMATGQLPLDQLVAIIRAANRHLANTLYQNVTSSSAEPNLVSLPVVAHYERLRLQQDTPSALRIIEEAVAERISGCFHECLLYEPSNEILWSTKREHLHGSGDSAASGLLGYICRTAEPLMLRAPARDRRYDPDTDNPTPHHNPQFLAVPVTAGDPVRVLALIVVIRDSADDDFTLTDLATANSLAASCAPALNHVLTTQHLGSAMVPTSVSGSESRRQVIDVMPSKALDPARASLLLRPPSWLNTSHWALVALGVLILVYLLTAQTSELASGTAIVRYSGETVVPSPSTGIVAQLFINDGSHVQLGDPLLRLTGSFSGSLAERYKLIVRANSTGIIDKLNVRQGQPVSAQDPLVTITDQPDRREMIALLPVQIAPQLILPASAVLRLTGYPDSRVHLSLTGVRPFIASQESAALLIGKASDGVLAHTGASLICTARFDKNTFTSEGHVFSLQDGMTGRVEVKLRSEPLLLTLIPSLKHLREVTLSDL